MILRGKDEGGADIMYGEKILQHRPKQACEDHHKQLEPYLVGCLADAAFAMGEVEETLCLSYDKLFRLGIRHHYNDETEEEEQRYGVVAPHCVGYRVAWHTVSASRYFRVQQSVVGEERLLVVFRQAYVTKTLAYSVAWNMQGVGA